MQKRSGSRYGVIRGVWFACRNKDFLGRVQIQLAQHEGRAASQGAEEQGTDNNDRQNSHNIAHVFIVAAAAL